MAATVAWKTFDTGAPASPIVSNGRFRLASPASVLGNPSLAMQSAGQQAIVNVYSSDSERIEAVLTVSGTTPVAIVNAAGQPFTAQGLFNLSIEVTGCTNGEVIYTTDEPNGTLSNPFADTAARNAAYAVNLPAPNARVFAGDPILEYKWKGGASASTDGDWVLIGAFLGFLTEAQIQVISKTTLPIGVTVFNTTTKQYLQLQNTSWTWVDADATNGFISPSTGIITGSGYHTSPYIAVSPGDVVSFTKSVRFLTAFNGVQTLVGIAVDSTNQNVTTYTVPSGVYYIRVSVADVVAPFKVNWAAATFLPSGLSSSSSASPVSAWTGKRIAFLTDSLGNTGWPGYACGLIGATPLIYAVGGTQISGPSGNTGAMCQTARIAAIDSTVDGIIVCGGTNDWAHSVALGAIGNGDPTTFYGALDVLFTNLLSGFTAKQRISILTTCYGEAILPYSGWTYKDKNLLGLRTKDYADAIRKSCLYWGIPYIDTDLNNGWNTLNIAAYVSNDGLYLHPNATGAARIGNVVAGKLTEIGV